ncbi:hypothetical protein Ancab_002974 [Ancistrocladus abbreviatus]
MKMANQSANSGEANLCVNNCGFFGNPVTSNLCLKCYKDYLLKQSKRIEESILAAEKNIEEFDRIQEKNKEKEVAPDQQQYDSIGVDGSTKREPNQCCCCCNKRVGLTGYKCRCGQTFCSEHRYSGKHN